MSDTFERETFKMRIQVQAEDLKNENTPGIGKHYVISDIHGMYGSYMEVIKKLSKEDKLYIIGDVIDRGDEGIKIIQDIMERQRKTNNGPQIIFLLGNHEVMFLQTVNLMLTYGMNRDDLIRLVENKDNIEVFYDSIKSKGVSQEEIEAISNWINNNHGDKTIFRYLEDLGPSKMKETYKFLLEANVILPQKIGEQDFLFVHAMPIGDKNKLEEMKKTRKGYNITELTLEEYRFMLTERDEETYQLAQDAGFITICGHTPTPGMITSMKNEGFIRVDAGCGQGKSTSKLALYCIEDESVEYIDEKNESDIGEYR